MNNLIIPNEHIEWANKQPLFFVATAPKGDTGHVNCSPKGGPCFHLSHNKFIYADYTGSGIETIAHLQENNRICIMFCSFDKNPKILRFHGSGRHVLKDNKEFETYLGLIPYHDSIRAFIIVDIKRFEKSCGYGVPIMEFKSHRDTLLKWADAKSYHGIIEYQKEKNSESIDGLKGL